MGGYRRFSSVTLNPMHQTRSREWREEDARQAFDDRAKTGCLGGSSLTKTILSRCLHCLDRPRNDGPQGLNIRILMEIQHQQHMQFPRSTTRPYCVLFASSAQQSIKDTLLACKGPVYVDGHVLFKAPNTRRDTNVMDWLWRTHVSKCLSSLYIPEWR